MKNILHDEKGAVLVIVMIAVLVGGLTLPFFFGNVGTSLIGSRDYRNEMDRQYAQDAGAEHAIWFLTYGGLTDLIPENGDAYSYDLPETINSESVHVLVSNSFNVLAWDNFNSGTWTGGDGWLDNWATYGSPETTTSDSPKEGTYHVRMNNTDRITRSLDLSQAYYASVRFWYKQTNNFDNNQDYAYLQVSNNGVDYTTALTWSSSNNTYYSTYRFLTVPLRQFGLSSTFYIRFRAATSSSTEYCYIDDLDVVWMAAQTGTLAEEDFESGDWTGGDGWKNDAPWSTSGDADVVEDIWIWPRYYAPHGGDYQAQLYENNSSIYREIDLSGQSVTHLKFWGRQINFDSNDRFYVQVRTSDYASWQTAATFSRNGTSGTLRLDGTWRSYDIDLSGYSLTASFWIRFLNSAGNNEYVWLDDIKLNTTYAYFITVTVEESILRAAVDLMFGTPQVISWVYES